MQFPLLFLPSLTLLFYIHIHIFSLTTPLSIHASISTFLDFVSSSSSLFFSILLGSYFQSFSSSFSNFYFSTLYIASLYNSKQTRVTLPKLIYLSTYVFCFNLEGLEVSGKIVSSVVSTISATLAYNNLYLAASINVKKGTA